MTPQPILMMSLTTVLSTTLVAGPPLLCDKFDIGSAHSLPWSEGRDWHSPDPSYNVKRLIPDTLALLAPQTPVIVRMETLRRAAIYASKDPRLAYELLSRLTARALSSETTGKTDALVWFDAGYLVETYHQLWEVEVKAKLAEGVDGYAWTLRAIQISIGNAEMEYAAALMKLGLDHTWPNEHFRRALAGSKENSLLARNLSRHKK